MKFHWRKTINLGVIRWNFTQAGYSSWGLHLWRLSWNSARGFKFDTPGPGYVSFGRRKRGA